MLRPQSAALTLMISDLYRTNSQIFNPLCSSPLPLLLPLSRGYCFAPLFGWNWLLPPSSLCLPPLTSPLLSVPHFLFFSLFSFSLSSSFFFSWLCVSLFLFFFPLPSLVSFSSLSPCFLFPLLLYSHILFSP